MLNILPKVIQLVSGGARIQTKYEKSEISVSFTIPNFKYIWITNIITY